MPVTLPKKAPAPNEALLLTYAGAQLVARLPLPMQREVTHMGRFFLFNDQFSQAAKRPVYCEMTHAIVAEMRGNAEATMSIAARIEARLVSMGVPVPAPATETQQ